ncbi:hypothetical protein TWF506_010723 [Arthrobotrys conoides]|uniref:Uncharacterized protein n=1 Tax=Arthrobotrys conoides TaxID=74498 RepID=A0AAN8NI18_9PEZI
MPYNSIYNPSKYYRPWNPLRPLTPLHHNPNDGTPLSPRTRTIIFCTAIGVTLGIVLLIYLCCCACPKRYNERIEKRNVAIIAEDRRRNGGTNGNDFAIDGMAGGDARAHVDVEPGFNATAGEVNEEKDTGANKQITIPEGVYQPYAYQYGSPGYYGTDQSGNTTGNLEDSLPGYSYDYKLAE